MRIFLKVVGWGLGGLLAIGLLLAGASFVFPKAFAPKIKTQPMRAPSGTVYNIMNEGPVRGVNAGAKTLGVQYLVDAVTADDVRRGADEIEALMRPKTSNMGFDSLRVMAYRIVKQRGFISYGESVDTVFERAPSVQWDIFGLQEQSVAPAAEAIKKDLLSAYAKLDEAVRAKDARAIWEMETEDYTDTLIDGSSMKKDADLTYMQKEFAGLDGVSAFDVRIFSLEVSGDTASAVVKSAFSGSVNEENRRGQTYYSEGWSRDIWRKTKNGWRISASFDLGSKSFFFKL